MIKWGNSSGSLAGKIAKTLCYCIFVIVFSGCTKGCRLFSRPTLSYSVWFLAIDDDDALWVNSNESKFNIDLTGHIGDKRYNYSKIYPFKKDFLAYIDVILKNNEYPEDLDDMFIIENKTDKPQRCFAIITGGYRPASVYKKGQEDILDGIDISIFDFNDKINSIMELESKGYKDYTVEDYWFEVNKKNPKIAFVVPPKAKIFMKW